MDTPPDTDAACYAMPSSLKLDEPSSTVLDKCDIAHQAPESKYATQPRYGFAASHAVLKTYELLEMILIHVGTTPPDGTKTLLLCQRVNKDFKSVIGRSHILQQALFFELAPAGGERFGVDGANPLFGPHCETYRLFAHPLPRSIWDQDHRKVYYCDAVTREKLSSSARRMYPSHTDFPMSALRDYSTTIHIMQKDGRLTMSETVKELTTLAYLPHWEFRSSEDYDRRSKIIQRDVWGVATILMCGPRDWKWKSYTAS